MPPSFCLYCSLQFLIGERSSYPQQLYPVGMALVLMFTTCPDQEVAEHLAEGAISAGLAACILKTSVDSIFDWQGESQREGEIVTLFKTSVEKADDLELWLSQHHPYDTPAIIRIGARANAPYEEWLNQQLDQESNSGMDQDLKDSANTAVGSSGTNLLEAFGGQATVAEVEESNLSEDEAIAQVQALMEGMDELDDMELD